MSDPFSRDGRLSESALRRMAREAAGARRHVGGGADNYYTTPGGMVQIPQSPSGIPYYQFPTGPINLPATSFNNAEATDLQLTVPPGTYWIGCKLNGMIQNISASPVAAYIGILVNTSAGTLFFSDSSYIVSDTNIPSGAFARGSGFIQYILVTSEQTTLTLWAGYGAPSSGDVIPSITYDTGFSTGDGGGIIALKLS